MNFHSIGYHHTAGGQFWKLFYFAISLWIKLFIAVLQTLTLRRDILVHIEIGCARKRSVQTIAYTNKKGWHVC